MGFEVDTLKFEGPLDLMLHLIKEQQLDIFDLDMVTLADQYIAYLNAMEELQLEIESEYLVELAILIEYKSRKLLPKPAEPLEDDYEEDPRERLVKRLLEYQQYKDVSEKLYTSYLERQDQLSKPLTFFENEDDSQRRLEGDPYDLYKAMSRVLRRVELNRPIETRFTRKEVSTEDRILELRALLTELPDSFGFKDLCKDCQDIFDYLVTFLAILDMAKDHYLTFVVDADENIVFSKGVGREQDI